MAQTFSGRVEIQDSGKAPSTRVALSGDEGSARLRGPVGDIASTLLSGKFVHVGAKPVASAAKAAPKSALKPPVTGSTASDPVISTENAPKVWLTVGDEKLPGAVFVVGAGGLPVLRLNGKTGGLFVGGNGLDGDVFVLDASGVLRVRINGRTGDIELAGADCAEEFDAEVDASLAEPGTVMSIADSGLVGPCRRAFDTRVAGIVSGAGSFRPGIILDRSAKPSSSSRVALALAGKAFCKVDAGFAPIRPGDLLAASATAGHARGIGSRRPPPGCVIGKALAPMAAGRGLIPVLVALR